MSFDDQIDSVFAVALNTDIMDVLALYEKWGKALHLAPQQVGQYLTMRMSFQKMKAKQLELFKDQLGATKRAASYKAEMDGENARRHVLEAVYAQVGHRLAFKTLRADEDYQGDILARALDVADAIEKQVVEHQLAKPMDPELAFQIADLEKIVAEIEALPDTGEFDLPEDTHHAE